MPTGVYERTTEYRAKMSKAMLESDTAKASNEAKRGVPLSPEHSAAISAAKIGVPRTPFTPEHRAALSAAGKNSDAVKAAGKVRRGGQDIVWHHTLYDHTDLSLNRVAMTRSNHAMGHRLLQKLGIEIPHINVKVVRI